VEKGHFRTLVEGMVTTRAYRDMKDFVHSTDVSNWPYSRQAIVSRKNILGFPAFDAQDKKGAYFPKRILIIYVKHERTFHSANSFYKYILNIL